MDSLNTRFKIAVRWFAAAYLVLAAATVIGLYSTYNNSQDDLKRDTAVQTSLRASDQRQNDAIRTILCLADSQTQTSKQRTPQEKAERRAFYAEALKSVRALPCDHWVEKEN